MCESQNQWVKQMKFKSLTTQQCYRIHVWAEVWKNVWQFESDTVGMSSRLCPYVLIVLKYKYKVLSVLQLGIFLVLCIFVVVVVTLGFDRGLLGNSRCNKGVDLQCFLFVQNERSWIYSEGVFKCVAWLLFYFLRTSVLKTCFVHVFPFFNPDFSSTDPRQLEIPQIKGGLLLASEAGLYQTAEGKSYAGIRSQDIWANLPLTCPSRELEDSLA